MCQVAHFFLEFTSKLWWTKDNFFLGIHLETMMNKGYFVREFISNCDEWRSSMRWWMDKKAVNDQRKLKTQGLGWTHCGLVMPYDDIDLGQHWLRWWLVAWWVPSHYLNQMLTCCELNPLRTNFGEILVEIRAFLFKAMHLQISAKCQPFCSGSIEAETKWPQFSRRHFQVHFLEWKWLNTD